MAQKWTRIVLCICLLCMGIYLFLLSGGFPPHAWKFLLQVIPQLPRLWERQGVSILLPFFGLVLLAATLLLAWTVLAIASICIVYFWWQERRELRRFDEDVQEAQHLAEATSATVLQQQETLLESNSSDWPIPAKAPATLAPNKTAVPASFQGRHEAQARKHGCFHHDKIGPLQIRPAISDKGQAQGTAPTYRAQTPVLVRERDLVKIKVEMNTDTKPGETTLPLPPLSTQAQPSTTQLLVGTGLDPGIKRKGRPNEDSLFVFQDTRLFEAGPQPIGLFMVADGMGGHGNGQEASSLAISSISDNVVPALVHGPEDEIFTELLAESVQRANLAVHKRNQQQRTDMGTTLTAALLVSNTAYVANVGDSRTYLYRATSGLSKITRDHSTVAQLVEMGAITPEDVYTHPERNVIYRSLGHTVAVKVDTFTVPLQTGDLLLLCSDGLWEMVRDPQVQKIIETSLPHPAQISAMLIQAALNRGGKDNIGVVVVLVSDNASP